MLGEALGGIETFTLHFERWLGIYRVDKVGLDMRLLGKRNSLDMNFKTLSFMLAKEQVCRD